jgi:CDP-glucose 4,6-dehydratase
MSNNKFKGKNVVITGHTGFKGSWLIAWLKMLGANVTGISLNIPTSPSHFNYLNISDSINDLRIDIRNQDELEDSIRSARPDYLFHLAAQSLVIDSYVDPITTWNTNLIGTVNILESLRKINEKCSVVIITSDKCYDNVEWTWGYRENDKLGGIDPYSASKGAAELAIRSYVKSFFNGDKSNVKIASARAGNVIGGGDWSINRIVPDCMRSITNNEELLLRNPNAIRPWQHVLEPLSGYLQLAVTLDNKIHGEAYNFGPSTINKYSVNDLVSQMNKSLNDLKWTSEADKKDAFYESGLLMLNCDKALNDLSWYSVMNFEQTVKMTSEWYRDYNKDNCSEITLKQIKEYKNIAVKKGLMWTNLF